MVDTPSIGNAIPVGIIQTAADDAPDGLARVPAPTERAPADPVEAEMIAIGIRTFEALMLTPMKAAIAVGLAGLAYPLNPMFAFQIYGLPRHDRR